MMPQFGISPLEASITILEASLFTIQGTVMIVTYDHNLRLQYVYSTGHWSYLIKRFLA